MVGRECEFLSYYIDEYNKILSTNPQDYELSKRIDVLKSKLEAYDKVYRFILKAFKDGEVRD